MGWGEEAMCYWWPWRIERLHKVERRCKMLNLKLYISITFPGPASPHFQMSTQFNVRSIEYVRSECLDRSGLGGCLKPVITTSTPVLEFAAEPHNKTK
jgi:hypothetical protein